MIVNKLYSRISAEGMSLVLGRSRSMFSPSLLATRATESLMAGTRLMDIHALNWTPRRCGLWASGLNGCGSKSF
jgi:hypothetical protein